MRFRLQRWHRPLAVLIGLLVSVQVTGADAVFFRGLNLNGPALTIDGRAWDGKDSTHYTCQGNAFENQSVPLEPPTDPARAQMIRSSRWGGELDLDILNVPEGHYQVFLYVWEDNHSETFSLHLNNRTVVLRFQSGPAGAWQKLGPWKTVSVDGRIGLAARGGAANLSGIEIWAGHGAIPGETDTGQREAEAAPPKPAWDWAQAREFWSLRPIRLPPIPVVRQPSWPRGDLDRFVLDRLEKEQLEPAVDADKRALLRRATYDLIGLPPSPEEIDAYLADTSAHAFDKVVDRLLASPHYGERWGRYWLDVVRYADTAGDNSDFPIPQMYRYRNWVIDAFNQDLPYDQFVREQLAGDLLPSDDPARTRQRLIATGYIANARRFGSRVDDYPQHLTIEDTLDNVGRTFLGLTVNCARCHDHKFDPITTEDYYALYGIFHSTRYPWPGIELEQQQRDLVPLVPPEEAEAARAAHQEKRQQLDDAVKRIQDELKAAEGDAKKELQASLDTAKKEAETHRKTPLPFEQAYAVIDGKTREDVPVQLKGDPAKSGEVVRRHFLTVLNGAELPEGETTSGRLRLADWILDRDNPLTARVMVNRIWLGHFGKGIVPTPNDFGRQGKPPTHAELLDWLAWRFLDSQGSVKTMHRIIMHSRTYQLSSLPRNDASADRDPVNDFYGHFPRRRLEAEAIRDTLLALGGNLDTTPAGPHPFPPQTEWSFTQHNPFKAVYETRKRSVYLMTQRIQRHPYLAIFDGADPAASTPVRMSSTTPLQALYLLNDPFLHEQSERFAERLSRETGDDTGRLNRAYEYAFGRLPEEAELESGRTFLRQVRNRFQDCVEASASPDQEAWRAMVRVLFRLNEFVYID